jgi:hypothetical protein
VPGKTSPTDAAVIIAADTELAASQIVTFASDNGEHVAALMLNRPALSLGEVLALYGKPQCVDIFRQVGTVTLHYALLHVLTRFQDDHLSPDSPILSLVLGNMPGMDAAPPCDGPQSAEVDTRMARRRWKGFASLQQYLGSIF